MHWKFDIDLRSLVRAVDDLSVKSAKLAFPDSYPIRVDFLRSGAPYAFVGQFKATVKPVNQQTSSPPLALMEVPVGSIPTLGPAVTSSTANGVLNLATTGIQDFVRPYGERPVALELMALDSSGAEIASWTVNCELSRRYTETGVVVIDVPNLKANKDEAEVGLNNTKWMTPVRVWDSIRKWAEVHFIKATQLEAETGTDNSKYMTPVRVWDSIRKWAEVNFVGHKHTDPIDIKDALAASGIEVVEDP
jgi:hypothetical protein